MYRGGMGVALVAACWFLSVPAQAQFSTYPSQLGAARHAGTDPVWSGGKRAAGRAYAESGARTHQPAGGADGTARLHQQSAVRPHRRTSSARTTWTMVAFSSTSARWPCNATSSVPETSPSSTPRPKDSRSDRRYPIRSCRRRPAPPRRWVSTASRLLLPWACGGTVGYLWGGNQSVELTSFYVWQNDVTTSVNAPGMLDTLFYNPPLTFAGDHLFRQADQVSTVSGSSLFSSELNYRRWNGGVNGLELIAGVRFVRQNDLLNITTQGEALVQNSLGLPTPGRDMAMYDVICHNNITAPQIGGEYSISIFSWLSLAAMGK